jgi:uncharacterized protein YcfJ
MKTRLNIAIVAIGLALGLSGSAFADRPFSNIAYEDRAPVISATPIYETVEVVEPQRECWTEPARHSYRHDGYRRHARRNESYTAPLVGAIAGGVVGNQFGSGSGNTALTVGGALLGASIGNDYNNAREPVVYHRDPPRERHCETTRYTQTREELVGYRVRYRYNGETHVTRMAQDPGDYVRVRVGVRP